MAIVTDLEILQHLETELAKITKANGYNNDVKFVDREYRERSSYEYPFVFINDVEAQYIKRICKNLYKKGLAIQIVGFVYSDTTTDEDYAPQLGTVLQLFKNDIQKCLAQDTWFNTSDKELKIIDISTEEGYVPPNATFSCNVVVIHYDVQ